MNSLIWTTDLHLDRLSTRDFEEFLEYLSESTAEAFIISGDIGEGDSTLSFLAKIAENFANLVYFILGNHDYYDSSFEKTHSAVSLLTKQHSNLHWLSEKETIKLNETTAIIGNDGWSDGRYGIIQTTGLVPRDFQRNEDLARLSREDYESTLNNLGDASAAIIKDKLTAALESYENIYLVTHVPPFKEACLDRSRRISGDDRLPYYTCKALGDTLLRIMKDHPNKNLTVLCGHTHENCEYQPLPNLTVKVKDAGYGTWFDPQLIKLSD